MLVRLASNSPPASCLPSVGILGTSCILSINQVQSIIQVRRAGGQDSCSECDVRQTRPVVSHSHSTFNSKFGVEGQERRVKRDEWIGVAASGTFLIEIRVPEIAALGERLKLGHTLCAACCREQSHHSAHPLGCHFPRPRARSCLSLSPGDVGGVRRSLLWRSTATEASFAKLFHNPQSGSKDSLWSRPQHDVKPVVPEATPCQRRTLVGLWVWTSQG